MTPPPSKNIHNFIIDPTKYLFDLKPLKLLKLKNLILPPPSKKRSEPTNATKYQSNTPPRSDMVGKPRDRHARTQKVLLEGVQFIFNNFFMMRGERNQRSTRPLNFNGVSLAAELMAQHCEIFKGLQTGIAK